MTKGTHGLGGMVKHGLVGFLGIPERFVAGAWTRAEAADDLAPLEGILLDHRTRTAGEKNNPLKLKFLVRFWRQNGKNSFLL